MKRTKQCPKCQSLTIGYLPSQPDADSVVIEPAIEGLDPSMPAHAGDASQVAHRALGLSRRSVFTGYFAHGEVTPMIGRLETYVCTECGYHETYVASPATIEWDKLAGFTWVNERPRNIGPYR